MTTVQIIVGIFFVLFGLGMLLKPTMFATQAGCTPPAAFGAGLAVVGAGTLVGVVQDKMLLVVLGMVLAVVGIALIVVGIVRLRQRHPGD